MARGPASFPGGISFATVLHLPNYFGQVTTVHRNITIRKKIKINLVK